MSHVQWATAFILWLSTAALSAQSQVSDPLRGMDSYIEQALVDWQVPGAAVGVLRDGKVIYARGFGVREAGKPQQVDQNTLFQVGSMTKAFTATALGILVDQGKVAWDDPVIDHLPWFRLSDPWLTRHVTIRDLLAHRTGIESTMMVVTLADAKEIVRRAQFVPSTAEFRQQYLYSNLMYGVAGQVIEAVSGQSWAVFVQQRLLVPLGMRSSGTTPYQFWRPEHVAPSFHGVPSAARVSAADALAPNVAMPHWLTADGPRVIPWQSYDNAAAAGAVVSNLTDMLRWLQVHLDAGSANGRTIVGRETMREMHAAQMLIGNPNDPIWEVVNRAYPSTDRPAYALGWFRNIYRGQVYISHSGGMLGFPSFGAILPEHGMGVIVLANSFGRGGQAAFNRLISFRVFDALLGLPPHDWGADLLRAMTQREQEARDAENKLSQQRLPHAPPSLPLARYVGEYRNPLVGDTRVDMIEGHLTFSIPGAFFARMEHWHLDTFRLVWTGGMAGHQSFATFRVDPYGSVTALDAGRIFGGELSTTH